MGAATISVRTVQSRVKRSAELLDKEVPGWYNKINVQTLNMSNQHCIVGQLNLHGTHDDMSEERGFYIDYLTILMDKNRTYDRFDTLHRLWKCQISKRKNKVKELQRQSRRINKELLALGV